MDTHEFVNFALVVTNGFIIGVYYENSQVLHVIDGIGTFGATLRIGINPKVSLLF